MYHKKEHGCAEWDMAWFCEGCEKLVPWNEPAFVKPGEKIQYCEACAAREAKPIPIW